MRLDIVRQWIFASEYGFKKNGDAWVMFDTALEMIGLDFNIGCRSL